MLRLLFILLFLSHSLTGIAQHRTGTASFYHHKFNGRKTASGDIFNNKKMTAASNHYKLGQWIKVTNEKNGKSVCVLVNDRMAKNSGRLIDLSYEAAKKLCFTANGVCRVKTEPVSNPAEDDNPEIDIIKDSIGYKE